MNNILFGASESLIGPSGMKAPNPIPHQLLIIGNGFDLECGLPTRFSHFFEPRLKALRSSGWKETGRIDGLGYEASPTVWDFLLKSKMYAPWYSIEDAIHDLVLSAGDGKSGATGLAAKLIERIYGLTAGGEGGADRSNGDGSGNPEEEDLLNSAIEFIAVDCADTLRDADAPWSAQKLVEYLGMQLERLERNFSNYMVSVTEGNGEYIERSFLLLGLMLADEWHAGERRELDTTVLTFNYTNPFKRSIGKADAVRIINVHGNLDEGIIFGIDGTRCADNPLAFPLSKTYRVMTAGTDFGEGAVQSGEGGQISHATRVIKFYGHSLGEADYAYFQAIFDSVSLYASNTKLIFYCKPRMGGDGKRLSEKSARNIMAARAAKLLAEYGKTLENKDHGRNLMHKLMIEGRLEVRVLKE